MWEMANMAVIFWLICGFILDFREASSVQWESRAAAGSVSHSALSDSDQGHVADAVVASMVMDEETRHPPSAHLLNPPKTITHKTPLTIQYACSAPWRVGVELRISTDVQSNVHVFRESWKCSPGYRFQQRTVTVRLPQRLAYRPSYFNPKSITVTHAEVLVWVVDPATWAEAKVIGQPRFEVAAVKVSHEVHIAPPYERLPLVLRACTSWGMEMRAIRLYRPMCPWEHDVHKALTFPAVLTGYYTGVSRRLEEFTDPTLRAEREARFLDPKFSISVWLYIVDYCPSGASLCSVVQRMTWQERYCSALIYINNQGQLHVQTVAEFGDTWAFITPKTFALPKNQWCHLLVVGDGNVFTLTRRCFRDRKEMVSNPISTTSFTYPFEVWYDDTQTPVTFGGTEIAPAFKGYIGQATIYRRRLVKFDEIPNPPADHPMFSLGLSEWDNKCRHYLAWADHVVSASRLLKATILDKRTCSDPKRSAFGLHDEFAPADSRTICPTYSGPKRSSYNLAYLVIRRLVLDGVDFTYETVGDEIYANVSTTLEDEGLYAVEKVLPLLRQASCYGNHDATFMLATVVNNGMGLPSDQQQAHFYLMIGALQGHPLCLLSLANKHSLGLDGVPRDMEQAYPYYKQVADRTRDDKEDHTLQGVYTEHIRLTDEWSISQQTEEDGDLFLWFKHQAAQGVTHAQANMARLLYWGAQGIDRNLENAAEYYRMGAEAGEPDAMYDYGIVLLKGHGVEKNETLAVEYFEKAAELGNIMSLNVLGWYSLEVERNNTKALHYLQRAYEHGNIDAAHNLGYMLLMGKFPNRTADRTEAFEYYSYAASRGQINSCVTVAMYNIRGTKKLLRNPRIAVDWARYAGELNTAVGKILQQGLRAYRHENWATALVFYHMAAETGLEVGQFNAAYLCEHEKEGLVSYLDKECIWRFYNLSITREEHLVNSYSFIKMGDYFWYGCEGQRDPKQAAILYGRAARREDPHALFNLAYLIEEGQDLPPEVMYDLGLDKDMSNATIVMELYTRCKDAPEQEAYLACSLALLRVQFREAWNQYNLVLKMSTALGAMVALGVTSIWIVAVIRSRRLTTETV